MPTQINLFVLNQYYSDGTFYAEYYG